MTKFTLISDKSFVSIDFHIDPSDTSALVAARPRLLGGMVVEPTGKNSEIGKWIEINYQMSAGAIPLSGWIQAAYLGDPVAAGPMSVPAVDEGAFVAECVRYEATSQDDRTIGADYLIAWAWIESSLVDFGPQLNDPDAIGPFQVNPTEWQQYLGLPPNISPGPDGRFSGYAQIDFAAWIGKRDVADFVAAMAIGPSPIDNYVPSLLNVFHCRLIGVPAAVEVQRIQTAKTANPTMDTVLAGVNISAQAIAALLVSRRRFLGKNPTGGFSTVEAFVHTTSAVLAEAMKKAFSLLKMHVPGFVPPVTDKTVAARWMAIAERELKDWTDSDWIESSGEGRNRVVEYFTAADNPHAPSEAWCGAFASWCLKQAGDTIGSTVVKDPERAANWKIWGDLELRQRDWAGVPRGAVVVLAPAANTASSGHVAFFRQTVAPEKIELLGGNQSDRVTAMIVERNRVVSIRWLSTLDVAPDSNDNTPIIGAVAPNASARDRIILARTLYGEARGEPQAGIEAVAEVVVNRAMRGGWFGNTIEQACLKPFQFSCWNANDPNRARIADKQPNTGDSKFDVCFDIAQRALIGQIAPSTDGATHYHADTMRHFPSWVANATKTAHIGHHIFYKNVA